jgi:hypothetical protein
MKSQEDRIMERRRVKHQASFEERLAEETARFKAASRNRISYERLAVIARACVAQMNEYSAYLLRPDGHIHSRI